MTTQTSAEGRVEGRWVGVVGTILALVIVLAGLWAVALIAYWYGADDVFVGGAHLRDPAAARLPAVVAGAVLLTGVVVLVLRRRLRATAALLGLVCLTVVGVVAAALAVAGYPSATHARLISHGNPADGSTGWSTVLPLTIVTELTDAGDGTITVIGSAMDHGCDGRYLAVTIQEADGRVVEVAPSSSPHYLGTGHIDPDVPAARGLVVDQGVSQVTCSY